MSSTLALRHPLLRLVSEAVLRPGLLTVAVQQVDLRQVEGVMAIHLLRPWLGAWRRRNIVAALRGRLSLPGGLRFAFIGMFFDQLLSGVCRLLPACSIALTRPAIASDGNGVDAPKALSALVRSGLASLAVGLPGLPL